MLGPSAHTDTFARDNLPPAEQWPEFLLSGFDYPDYINIGVELTDQMVNKGFGDFTALIGNGRLRTYKELTDWTNRIAHVLVEDYGVKLGQSHTHSVCQQPGHGGLLAGSQQSRSSCGQHHAHAACGRIVQGY